MPPLARARSLEAGHLFDQPNSNEAEADVDDGFLNDGGGDSLDAHPSQAPSRPSDYIPFLDRLRSITQIREIPWRTGQALPPEKAEDSPRVQQRGACLLSTRGKVMELKCEHCARGYGRFSLCVTMEPWFQGACSSCIFTSKGNKCSLRFQTSGTADGRALRYHTISDIPSATPRKRKRRSAPASTFPSHDSSSFSREQQVDSPNPESESPDLDTLLQAEIAREQASGSTEYILPTVERRPPRPRSVNPHRAVEARGSSSAWTPANIPSSDNHGALPNVSKSRDAAPVAAARWTGTIQEPPSTTLRISSPLPDNASQGPSLIDTFPKTKQRHIYGVIGGLESGIDHLNAQVSSLKALLGIDVDDAKLR